MKLSATDLPLSWQSNRDILLDRNNMILLKLYDTGFSNGKEGTTSVSNFVSLVFNASKTWKIQSRNDEKSEKMHQNLARRDKKQEQKQINN